MLNYAKEFKKTEKWTFQDRINVMARLLATRKNRCDVIMKGENLGGFVGAPGKMAKNSTANGFNNGKKSLYIEAGRGEINKTTLTSKSGTKNEAPQANDTPTGDTANGGLENHASPGVDLKAASNYQDGPRPTESASSAQEIRKRKMKTKNLVREQPPPVAPVRSTTGHASSASSQTSPQDSSPSGTNDLQQSVRSTNGAQPQILGSKRKWNASKATEASSTPNTRTRTLLPAPPVASPDFAHKITSQSSHLPSAPSHTEDPQASAAPTYSPRKRAAEDALGISSPSAKRICKDVSSGTTASSHSVMPFGEEE